MQSLIKIPLLLIFLCIGAFSDTRLVIYAENKGEFTRTNLESMGSGYYKEFANGKYRYYKTRGYSIESGYYFNSDTGISDGIYRDQNGNFFVVDSAMSLNVYCDKGFTFRALRLVECASSPVGKIRNHVQGRNSTKMILDIVAQCNTDEDFNTDTKQCQKCPDGQSWDPATNSCFNDCTDPNKNKYGFTDGSCTDCSAAKTTGDIYRCFCGSLGLGVPEALTDVGVIGKPGYFLGKCSSGYSFEYRDPDYKPDPKPDDNNKTKPDNPNPDNNKTKPDDPNNPGGGNNQGNNGNPKPNPNQGNNTNPNPDPKPNPKPGNGNSTNNDGNNNGGGGNNANGDNLKFTPDGSADKYQKDINDFSGKFKEAAGSIVGEFSNFKKGVDQLIANIEGKGIKDVKSQAIPSSCPMEFTVDMFGNSYVIKIDYCKYIAPAANVLYYIFYILFFLAFLLGVYKTVLFLI